MSDLIKSLIAGAYINSALYLAGVFIAGLATNNGLAWKMALTGAGLAYFCYAAQFVAEAQRFTTDTVIYEYVARTAVACSIVAGVIGGIALLWKP